MVSFLYSVFLLKLSHITAAQLLAAGPLRQIQQRLEEARGMGLFAERDRFWRA